VVSLSVVGIDLIGTDLIQFLFDMRFGFDRFLIIAVLLTQLAISGVRDQGCRHRYDRYVTVSKFTPCNITYRE